MGLTFICDRFMQQNDVEDLIDMQFRVFTEPRKYNNRDDAQKDLQPWLDDPALGTIVAYDGNAITGYALYRPMPDDVKRTYRAFLHTEKRFPIHGIPSFPPRSSELAYVFLQHELRSGNEMHEFFREIIEQHIRRSQTAAYTLTWNKGEEYVKRGAFAIGFQTLGEVSDLYKDSSATILKRDF